jgi:hypothetical protein
MCLWRAGVRSCPGLSSEQLAQLRDSVKASCSGVQGHSRTPEENARALLHIHQHQQQGLSYDAAVKVTAAADVASPSTLRAASALFTSSGTLPPPSTAHLGRGNPNHPLHSPAEPTFEIELCIHRALECTVKAEHTSVKRIQQQLLEEEHVHVGDFTLRRWLHELGYAWGDKMWVGALTPEYRDARIRSFIWNHAAALRLQRHGTHIIVYLDESYIHSGHQRKKGWHPRRGPRKNNETRGDADTGKRLIILHAMTADAMLDDDDAVGSNFLHEVTATAQFVFEAASFDDSDYHNTIDGEAFTLWVKNRLLPAFHKRYPVKKMIIVMDNASYHKPRDFDWITPYKMTKVACASFLVAQDLKQFTAERDGEPIVFKRSTWNQRAGNKSSPSLKELQQAVKSHLKQHPGINKTKIDKLLQPHGHSIVWTPPFVPEVQPIELIWAYVKQLVAAQYTLNRNIATTRQQTDDAFDSITPVMIEKRIAHCHAWIDAFMQTEEAGSLCAFGTLDKLVAAHGNSPAPLDIDSSSVQENDDDDADTATLN